MMVEEKYWLPLVALLLHVPKDEYDAEIDPLTVAENDLKPA